MKKFIFLALISILNSNCKDKIDKKKASNGYSKAINEQKTFEYIYLKEKKNWNKIIVTKVDTTLQHSYFNKTKINRYSPFGINTIYEFSNIEKIKSFENLIKESIKTGYCCCSRQNYSIRLYKNSQNYKNYDLDTITYKDSVSISEGPHYCYITSKTKWDHFLKQSKQLKYREFYIKDLRKARNIYKKAIKYNLPIINSHYLPEYWMKYDGVFDVYITVYKETDSEFIEKEIKNKYNNEKFYIDFSQQTVEHNIQEPKIKTTIRLTIYSDFDFYKKLEIFETKKSKFQIARGYFCVLGSEKKLKIFDEILKKSN